MSFSNCKSKSGSGFTESKLIITLLKGVHMTFLKSVKSAAVLMGIAGFLMFTGGAFAANKDVTITLGTAANTTVSGLSIPLNVAVEGTSTGDDLVAGWNLTTTNAEFSITGTALAVTAGGTAGASGLTLVPGTNLTAGTSKSVPLALTGATGFTLATTTLTVTVTADGLTAKQVEITLGTAASTTVSGLSIPLNVRVGGTSTGDDLAAGWNLTTSNTEFSITGTALAVTAGGAAGASGLTLVPGTSLTAGTSKSVPLTLTGATGFTLATATLTVTVTNNAPATALGIAVTDTKYNAGADLDTSVVEGNIRSVDAIKVTAAITPSDANVGGVRDTSLRFRWFIKAASGAPATADNTAAPGSVWLSAADGGASYAIPSALTSKKASTGDTTYYFFCRVRSTILKTDGVSDSISPAVMSSTRAITVKPRPQLAFQTLTNDTVSATTFKIIGSGTSEAIKETDSVSGTVGLKITLTEHVKYTKYGSTGTPTAVTDGVGVTYQWYRNTTNSNVGGIKVAKNSTNNADSKTLTLDTDMPVGNYYFFLEANADGAAPLRSTVRRVQILPAGEGAVALPALNLVQFQSGAPASITYDYSKVMALAVPAEGTGLVSPTYGPNKAVKFKVSEMIYQGIDEGNASEYFHYKSTGTATGPACTKEAACKLESNKTPAVGLQKAGKYSVTVIVENTEATSDKDGSIAAGKVKGSTTVTWTIEQKDINNITTKTNSMSGGSTYDGTTKNPVFTLFDGTTAAGKGRNLDANDYDRKNGNLTNAGEAWVEFAGKGNYKGTLRLSFQIAKKTITVDAAATSSTAAAFNSNAGYFTKTYDGTTNVAADPAGVDVKFSGLVNPTDIALGKGYTVSGLKFDNANVAATRSVSGTVTLIGGDTTLLSRNYTFGTSLSTSFTVTGVQIKKKSLTGLTEDDVKDIFSYKIPLHRLFTGKEQDIGTVGWNTAKYSSTGDTKTLYYTEAGAGLGPVTAKPVRANALGYAVTMNVSGSNNFEDATGISLGTFIIGDAKKPVLVFMDSLTYSATTGERDETNAKFDAIAYKNEPITLKAIGYRPDSSKTELRVGETGVGDSVVYYKSGTISYRWFTKADKSDTLRIGGKTPVTSAAYTVTYDKENSEGVSYWVEATYTNANVQVAETELKELKVTVKAERIDIGGATVTVGGSYIYSGKAFDVDGGDVKVMLKGAELAAENYTFVADGEEAGLGLVTVTGIGQYKGKASGTFVIAKAETAEDSLVFNPPSTSVQYNGAAQPISVKPNSGDGLGAVTIRYVNIDDEENPVTLAAAPKNAGKYMALISIAEGKNYTAFYTADEPFEREYTITKRFVAKEDLTFNWPKNGSAPVAIVATLKEKMGYTGTITTVYLANSVTSATVPTEAGEYIVRARLSGDDNFGAVTVTLDTLKIDENGKVGVKGSDRELPKPGVSNVVTVAPVKVTASGFTAGPSPVSNGSAIKFFSAKSVKSGTLYIFDANGNSVAKVAAKSGVGEIGSWNLKDKKGASVVEGTYVVKGALLGKDGTREKVSFVFSVVK